MAQYYLKFSFRTTTENTRIVTAENILNQIQFTIGLRSGHLVIHFPLFTMAEIVPFALNDNTWYTITLNKLQTVTFTSDCSKKNH